MEFSVRSSLTTAVAAVSAVAIAAAPSVAEPSHHPASVAAVPQVRVVAQPVQLSAAAAPLTTASVADLPNLLTDFVQRIVVPPSSSASFPSPEFPPVVVGNSLSSGIKNIYNAVEPWVEWGFEVAAYAVGWVPWVGWLSPQIMIFYYLGERIVQSITFNIADWIGGSVSFVQGLRNVAVDTINSFIYFANDQLAFWLPPLPPIPPIGGGLLTTAQTAELNLAGARTAARGPAAVDTALSGEVTDGDGPQEESETPPAEPPAEEPVQTPGDPIDTEPEDVEPQEPVETPATDLDPADEEDLTDEDTEQDVDVEDTTDAGAEVDTEKPDTVKDDPGPDPKADSDPDDKTDTKPDTKPDTKNDTKPSPKNDSGSGSDQ